MTIIDAVILALLGTIAAAEVVGLITTYRRWKRLGFPEPPPSSSRWIPVESGPTMPAEAEWASARWAWARVRREEWDNATPAARAAIDALGTLIGIHDGGGEPEAR